MLDVPHVVGVESNVGSAGNTLCLLGAADTDDCTGDGWISQGPRDSDLAGLRVVVLAYGTQPFDQPQIAGEQRFLKVRAVFSPIVLWKRSNPVARHGAA